MLELFPEEIDPNFQVMGPLLPNRLQSAIDRDWKPAKPGEVNGRVYAAVVSKDRRNVFAFETTFAVRNKRFKWFEVRVEQLEMGLDEAILELRMHIEKLQEHADETLDVSFVLQGDVLKIMIKFKTVNITAFGITPDGEFVTGHHKNRGPWPWSGVLNIPDLFLHGEGEVRDESGLDAYNLLQTIGFAEDEWGLHYVCVFPTPHQEECLRLFSHRKDPYKEMDGMLFFTSAKQLEQNGTRQWGPLRQIAEAVLGR